MDIHSCAASAEEAGSIIEDGGQNGLIRRCMADTGYLVPTEDLDRRGSSGVGQTWAGALS